jgi:hypothetical protein
MWSSLMRNLGPTVLSAAVSAVVGWLLITLGTSAAQQRLRARIKFELDLIEALGDTRPDVAKLLNASVDDLLRRYHPRPATHRVSGGTPGPALLIGVMISFGTWPVLAPGHPWAPALLGLVVALAIDNIRTTRRSRDEALESGERQPRGLHRPITGSPSQALRDLRHYPTPTRTPAPSRRDPTESTGDRPPDQP